MIVDPSPIRVAVDAVLILLADAGLRERRRRRRGRGSPSASVSPVAAREAARVGHLRRSGDGIGEVRDDG